MKKVIKLTDKKLNEIIRGILKEQSDEQITNTGPSPEEISGSPHDEGVTPSYDEFLNAAEELLGQGLTIGNLVDKLCEIQKPSEPETKMLPTEPESDSAIPYVAP